MDIIIVCHTEFGFVRNGQIIYSKKATDGVEKGVYNLSKLAAKYGAKISYAVMPEVVKHFPKFIDHEIGLHIHPGWQEFKSQNLNFYVGDSYLREHVDCSSTSTVLKDYSLIDQRNMIKTGREWVEQYLNTDASFFVAGRWSIDNNTVKVLNDLGFTHDCSAAPNSKICHYDWTKLPRICTPYRPCEDNYQQKGDLDLIIVPISQMIKGGSVNPEVTPLLGLAWLKACFREYCRCKVPLFHICLHSPSMVDPYFLYIFNEFLEFIVRYDITFKFVSDINIYDNIYKNKCIIPYIFGLNKSIARTIFLEIPKKTRMLVNI